MKQRLQKTIALGCLAAILGFATLVALHNDDRVGTTAAQSSPCLICQLASTAKPLVGHVQAPAFVARVEGLLHGFTEEAPTLALVRNHYIRPPPALLSLA